jgi:hypothetical protein
MKIKAVEFAKALNFDPSIIKSVETTEVRMGRLGASFQVLNVQQNKNSMTENANAFNEQFSRFGKML